MTAGFSLDGAHAFSRERRTDRRAARAGAEPRERDVRASEPSYGGSRSQRLRRVTTRVACSVSAVAPGGVNGVASGGARVGAVRGPRSEDGSALGATSGSASTGAVSRVRWMICPRYGQPRSGGEAGGARFAYRDLALRAARTGPPSSPRVRGWLLTDRCWLGALKSAVLSVQTVCVAVTHGERPTTAARKRGRFPSTTRHRARPVVFGPVPRASARLRESETPAATERARGRSRGLWRALFGA